MRVNMLHTLLNRYDFNCFATFQNVSVRVCHQVKEILQEEEDLSEIVQLVGKASKSYAFSSPVLMMLKVEVFKVGYSGKFGKIRGLRK